MSLQDKIQQKHNAAGKINEKIKKTDTPIPQYGIGGVVIQNSKKKNRKTLKIIIPIASIMIGLVGFIYLPQLFMKGETGNQYLVSPNKDAVTAYNEYLRNNTDKDFDNDGLTNRDEIENGTNPYFADTDKDGLLDGVDQNPLHPDDDVYKAILASGKSVKTAYSINSVILWADDRTSLVSGSVTETFTGYYFSNFRGWAKFPTGKYAYLCENGRHQLLKYRSAENAWRIDKDCAVVIRDEKQKTTNALSFFGKTTYIKNKFGDFLSVILPDTGFITCTNMWLNDTYISTDEICYAEYTGIKYDENDQSRYGAGTTRLSDLLNVYNTISDGYSVLASLYSDKDGESIVEIYGFDLAGNLLVMDPHDEKKTDMLYLLPSSFRALDANGELTQYEYFEFYGCGFNSGCGDTISFFAAAVENNSGENNPEENKEPAETQSATSTEEEEPSALPQNGTFEINGVTNYYIDGLVVLSSFIREVDGKFEKCRLTDENSFYINDKGIRENGRFTLNGKEYVFAETSMAYNCYVCEMNGVYTKCSFGTRRAIYVNANGCIEKGWFKIGDKQYYASSTGVIQKNVFIKDQNGVMRYLKNNGQFAANCLLVIDGVEIMFNESGKIINQDYAVNIIAAHMAQN